MTRTSTEQLLIELINRARLDPLAEAARYGLSDLNSGLNPNEISSAAKQVLAGNAALESAAAAHSTHMLNVNQFEHDGIGDGTIGSRATAAGYTWSGLAENISRRGTSGTVDLEASIQSHHSGLFLSNGHRRNIMNDSYEELGVGQEVGQYTSTAGTFNTSMLTEKFGYKNSSDFFLTGVTYNDSDGDDFYSVGEGHSGHWVSVAGGTASASHASGGYEISLPANTGNSGSLDVSYGAMTVSVVNTGTNVKLDFVNFNEVDSSSSITALNGVSIARLLGIADLTMQGSGGNETLIGNAGGNIINGGDGNDTLGGRLGDDTLGGDGGNDWLWGEQGDDWLWGLADHDTLRGGSGNDTLMGGAGNDSLGGDDGNDHLDGGYDSDWMWGGAGADKFHFAGWGWHDFIRDFEDGIDKIDLKGEGWGHTSVNNPGLSVTNDAAGNAFISLGYNTWISLNGVDASQITDADFIF